MRRNSTVRWLVYDILYLTEDQDFVNVSLKKFYDHLNKGSLEPRFREITYKTALAAEGKKAFDGLLKVSEHYFHY